VVAVFVSSMPEGLSSSALGYMRRSDRCGVNSATITLKAARKRKQQDEEQSS
jgi:hypothetical protein